LNIGIGKLVNTLSLAPHGIEIEFPRPYPLAIVALHRLQNKGIEITNGLALEERPVPCLVAVRASIDEPGIEFFAVGVEPDLAAGLERFEATASAAGDPRLRGRSRIDGPSDLQNIAHTVLVFRSEVHQVGDKTSPLRARRGDVSDG